MTRNLQLWLLATALLAAVGCAVTSSTHPGAGVVAVAPRFVDLGSGWTEREFGFAVDPLDQPPESVNEAASRDHTNWRAVLAQVRAGMEREGAVGMGHFSYGFGNRVHGDGRYDLYLTRFPDQRSLERQWNRWCNHAAPSDRSSGPEVGDEAVWLPRSAADHDHRLVVRKGRYLARLECTAKQDKERLVELARVIVERVTRMTKSDGASNRRPAKQFNGSNSLSATIAAERALPVAVAELGRVTH